MKPSMVIKKRDKLVLRQYCLHFHLYEAMSNLDDYSFTITKCNLSLETRKKKTGNVLVLFANSNISCLTVAIVSLDVIRKVFHRTHFLL